MTDDPKEEQPSFGSYTISQGDETYGPYAHDTPWPEIAEDMRKRTGVRVVSLEAESGTVTLTAGGEIHERFYDPEDSLLTKIGLTIIAIMLAGVLLAGAVLFAVGIVLVVRDRVNTDRKARELPTVEEKLREACRLLDEVGFDGDPQPCLDEDGKPIK